MNKFDKPRILLPKGEALEPCIEAGQVELGIELPEYDGSKLNEETKDASFFFEKPAGIPGLLAEGAGDIALAGTDVVLEYLYDGSNRNNGLSSKRLTAFGPMCRFSILGLVGAGEDPIRTKLESDQRRASEPLVLATALPNTLDVLSAARDLPFMAYRGARLYGSIENKAKLLGLPGVVDLVKSGKTASSNSLVEVQKLLDIYPEMLKRGE